ncbi:MAG: hypothetical protein OCU22_04515 [Canidatus Methanoxibalbensis ujae]|nr:hypothetical protein [Candidatus Methanoxibalbensis ujae]
MMRICPVLPLTFMRQLSMRGMRISSLIMRKCEVEVLPGEYYNTTK